MTYGWWGCGAGIGVHRPIRRAARPVFVPNCCGWFAYTTLGLTRLFQGHLPACREWLRFRGVAFPQTTVAALPHGPSGNVRIHEVRGKLHYPIARHRASSTSSHLTKALSSLMISIDRVFIDSPFAEKEFRPGGLCLRPLLHREAGFIRNAIYKLFIPRVGSGLKITGHSMEMSAPPRISFLLEISKHGRPILSTPQNIFVPLSQCHPRFLFQGIPLGAASNVGMKRWSSQSRVVDEPERPERREMDTLELT
uniref:Uncharacterized protein n=1 Tax=Coccidioides posadasii RMSCC 3488 TaxID=454284 RepID=A0A0J6F587_COCPO|nr:hypothetical protein CPAG_00451 [Coccidioides posadasii RMSCC 3488]